MSNDEIAKLHQLHKDGALTEQEYEAQKQAGGKPKPKKKWPWWIKLPVILVGIALGASGLAGLGDRGLAEVPKCDQSDARDLMKNAIEKNAAANTNTLRLLDLTDTREMSYSADARERVCQGTAFLNAGQVRVRYRMWLGTNDRLLIEVNEL